MEQRVTALEKGQELIIGKLDAIAKGIADGRLENEKRFGAIEGRLTGIEKTLDTRASTSDLKEVSGKISSVPTTWQIVAIIAALLVGLGTLALGLSTLRQPAPAAPPATSSAAGQSTTPPARQTP